MGPALTDDPYQQGNLAGCPAATVVEERLREELFELAATPRDREFITRRRVHVATVTRNN